MKVYNRTDFPEFDWKQLDGKEGTIRIARDGECELVAFQAEDGGLYVLAWIDRTPGQATKSLLDEENE